MKRKAHGGVDSFDAKLGQFNHREQANTRKIQIEVIYKYIKLQKLENALVKHMLTTADLANSGDMGDRVDMGDMTD